MPLSCPECAAQMPEASTFCPGCGLAMQVPQRAQGKVGPFPENIAGALAYLTFIPAILFLSLAPYNKNRFVRFHSLQCLMLWGALIVIAAALRLAAVVLNFVPTLGPLLIVLLSGMTVFAAVVLWLVLIVKALQGESWKLPLLGDFAERYVEVP
jgi:uncharacterized membrane protein